MERRWRLVLPMTWIGGVSVFAACQLFLDPNNLSNGDRTTDADVDARFSLDAAPDVADGTSPADSLDWKGQVPACSPLPPDAAAIVAVVGGVPGTVGPCPAGYAPAGQSGFEGIGDRDFGCTNGTCGCGAVVPSGSDCLNPSLRYYSDSQCATVSGSAPLSGCTAVSGGAYAQIVGTLSPTLDCPPSGEAGILAQTPRILLEVNVCKPVGAPTHGGCAGTDVAMTPTTDAVACYQAASADCAAGYTARSTFATNKAPSDTRRCDCSCRADPDGGCAGGSVNRYLSSAGGPACSAPNGSVGGSCQPSSQLGPSALLAAPPAPVEPACISDQTKSGDVTLTGPTFVLCCLTPCDACGRAATSPGGPCASALQACLADADCKDYVLGDAGADAGEGGASSAPPGYVAMVSCRATACAAECK